MKQIEGSARRVLRYGKLFVWQVSLGAVFMLGLALWAAPDAWVQVMLGAMAGICIGYVLCLFFRDTP